MRRVMIFSVLSVLLVTLVACAGGGGIDVTAPDSAPSDKPLVIQARRFVTGFGANVRGEEIRIFYRLPGMKNFDALRAAKETSMDEKHKLYEFVIHPKGANGELEFFFELKFARGNLRRAPETETRKIKLV
jgi:hypothetical protein